MKFDVNLKNSLNTDTIAEDVRAFGDQAAPALQNTGIERDGGVTNIYETKTDYATAGDHFITEDGNILESIVSGDQRLISVDGKQIGITSAYGVGSRTAFPGVDDACISSTGTVITAAVKGSGIQVNEYSAAGALLNTRTTTFANLAAVLQFFTSLSIIRYQGIKFADSLEFGLRLGAQVIILKESTPAQSLMHSLKTTAALGVIPAGAAISSIVYGQYLIIAGYNGRVSSFDGAAWRNYDGTGSGTGPYNSGAFIGNDTITAICLFTENKNTYIVFGGYTGKIASYSNGVWNAYNKAGTGLWNNSTVIGASIINALTVAYVAALGYSFLVVGSSGGKLGSYTTSGGWVLYNAGAGLCNNNTITNSDIYCINAIYTAGGETVVVVAGGSGRVGSKRYTGGAWNTKVYTDVSSADNPTNNGTVCGASAIISAINWNSDKDIIFYSAGGTVGHWHNYVWYNYNGAGGAGVCINNQTVTGATGNKVIVFGSTVLFTGLFRVGTWDGTNWKNYDGTGTGTGLYDNATWLNIPIPIGGYGVIAYQSQLIEYAEGGGGGSPVAGIVSISSSGMSDPLYTYGLTVQGNLYEGIGLVAYLYMYKYENGYYLLDLVGNTGGTTPGIIYIYNQASNTIYISTASYALPQISGGKTRHIVTAIPNNGGGSQVVSMGLVGYNDFSAFSTAAAFAGCPQANPVFEKYVVGPNYSDTCFYLTGAPTNHYQYITPLASPPTNLYQLYQTQNQAQVFNAYGKLTNAYGVLSSKPLELRIGFVSGVAAFYSAAVVDGISADTMGTLLTNLGEIDPSYMPDFQDDRILYRYNGQFFYVVLSKTLTGNVFQKISEKVYKINTISPLNILSMIDQRLHIGSSDYHGQMIFESTAAPATVATNVASVLAGAITADPLAENIYSNSIDVGDKLCYIANPTSANISLVGYRVPYGYQSIQEMISTYIADVYAFSTANDGSELVLVDPNNPVYVADTRLPVAIGMSYTNGTVSNGQTTIFLKPDYDGYEVGNEAKGVYTAFQLFGVTYLFDGVTIFQANIQNGIYAGKVEIAPASGLSFIAATPTQAYFLSAFDNSVYVFTGGRSLSKFQRLTQLPAVLRGIHSTRDNALLLETATSFIWVRDEIVTQNLKSAAQTSLVLYDTTSGIYIGNDSSRWRYSYASLGGSSTVVPLVWQSSYYGQTQNQRSNLQAFNVRIYSPGKAAQNVKCSVDAFDQRYHGTQTVNFPIKKTDYSSSGYYQFRIKPGMEKSLGASITLTIPEKTVIADIMAEYSDDSDAIVSGNATK